MNTQGSLEDFLLFLSSRNSGVFDVYRGKTSETLCLRCHVVFPNNWTSSVQLPRNGLERRTKFLLFCKVPGGCWIMRRIVCLRSANSIYLTARKVKSSETKDEIRNKLLEFNKVAPQCWWRSFYYFFWHSFMFLLKVLQASVGGELILQEW